MSQDSISGAEANKWGRETARLIADAIGASRPTGNSNACVLNGKRVVIKSANVGTTSVGVTYKMLENLDEIVGAFARDDGSFDLWALPPKVFTDKMRPTESTGSSAGKVGIVAKRTFEDLGRSMGRVTL